MRSGLVNEILATGGFVGGYGLLVASIIIKPCGEIHYTVITCFVILLTYSATMLNIKFNPKNFLNYGTKTKKNKL